MTTHAKIPWPALRRSNVGNLFVKNLSPEVTSRDLHEVRRRPARPRGAGTRLI